MDATEDRDLALQKQCPALISKLKASLPRFLCESTIHNHGIAPGSEIKIRLLVRQSKTNQLLKLIEPFQESPQFLDAHLKGLLDPLVFAFVTYVTNHASSYYSARSDRSPDVIPLPRAVCQILYVFCKVRGYKVISRFFRNKPLYMEPMLQALESWAHPMSTTEPSSSPDHVSMLWQERYIILLWLSHLVLAPFSLASMSSENAGRSLGISCLDIDFPPGTPSIINRLSHVSSFYLGFASKEREAASILLARLAVKPDISRHNLHQYILDSVCRSFYDRYSIGTHASSIYQLLGELSFLGKFVSLAEIVVLEPCISSIKTLMQDLRFEKSPLSNEVESSTSARRLMIKLDKAVAIASSKMDPASTDLLQEESPFEKFIGQLFTALADVDTSVRIAASKAFSLSVLKLKSDQAYDVLNYLDAEIKEKAQIWEHLQMSQIDDCPSMWTDDSKRLRDHVKILKPDFRNVDAKKWHGVILTLAQLLFRSAIPVNLLSIAIESLLVALHFEQRSSLGIAIGTSVRDAACFGLWSLARRYSTEALQETIVTRQKSENGTTIQRLANDLIVASVLDPEGNIRRGASAALQEMVGRHPATIKHGIQVIQAVNYHSVASGSATMENVGLGASNIHSTYWYAILNGLLGWRGVSSSNAITRRRAAITLGRFTQDDGKSHRNGDALFSVRFRLARTPVYMLEEVHGFLLALANMILATRRILRVERKDYILPENALSGLWSPGCAEEAEREATMPMSVRMEEALVHVSQKGTPPSKKLVLEGLCSFVSAIMLVTANETMPTWFRSAVAPPSSGQQVCVEIIQYSLCLKEPSMIRVAAAAAANAFAAGFCAKEQMVCDWIGKIGAASPTSDGDLYGVVAALGTVFCHLKESEEKSAHRGRYRSWDCPHNPQIPPITPIRQLVIETLIKLMRCERNMELRCAALKSLTSGVLKAQVCMDVILHSIFDCLGDYTLSEKGDIGSLLRMEAINSVSVLIDGTLVDEDERQRLMARVGGLAVEKLDKVRWNAWNCFKSHISTTGIHETLNFTVRDMSQTSSVDYFKQLLPIANLDWARKPLLEGFVTSAGLGSESLIQATRMAFVLYINTPSPDTSYRICMAVINIFIENCDYDRLAYPTMEFLVFLFQSNLMPNDLGDEIFWWDFFNALQKTQHKSSNGRKIEAAVNLFAFLAIPPFPMSQQALKQLRRMLLHRFSRVRKSAAEALYPLTGGEIFLRTDWSRSPNELKRELVNYFAEWGFDLNSLFPMAT